MAKGKYRRLEFDIHRGPDEYRLFIQDLRELLYKPISHEYVVQTVPSRWVDICLISFKRRITLRIDPRNLYVRGVSSRGRGFWEFSDSSLIPGSRPLLYPGLLFGPIGALYGRDGLLHVPDIPTFEWNSTPLGYFNLVKAVETINPKRMGRVKLQWGVWATSMYTIIQMTTEAARINPIAVHVVEHWRNPQPITLLMVSIQRAMGFGTFSRKLLKRVAKCSPRATFRRALLNMEYIAVKGIDYPVNIFGSVKVEDNMGRNFVIFDRDSDHTETISEGQCITLTGLSTEIDGEDLFIVRVNLCDGEIAEGVFEFNGIRHYFLYDKNQEKYVSGKYGNGVGVAVGYSVIENAFMATIHVIINGQKKSPAQIYGTIKASYGLENGYLMERGMLVEREMLEEGEMGNPKTIKVSEFAHLVEMEMRNLKLESSEPSRPQILFDKLAHECVPVKPQQHLSLTRRSIPVPVNSCITIEVALWDCSLSPDHQIAWGSVQFTPIIGTQFKNITGGDVQVAITCQ